MEEQIKHLILSGGVGVGERLPSIRALAGFLRVNRNTVSRVISDLEREGFVETRRGSGVYVLEPPVGGAERHRKEVIERVVDLAAARGVPLDEIAEALMERFRASGAEKTKILFIECTKEELDQFSDELEAQLPVEIERVMLEDLEKTVSGGDPPWSLAVTTFFHVHEVEEIMEPLGVETVALLAEANIESLQKLMALPERTTVGIIGASETCMVNLARSLEGAGLGHLDLRGEVYIDDLNEADKLFDEAQALLICSSITAKKISEMDKPERIEVIEENRTLDKGGVEMLGRMLRELRKEASDAG
ncbi:GntR family transcriptional regulator [Rubrobacter indicoceani]|uniref:GntR family transcriptional regulator n=1 Tax=Rubrobacter indicoceani TaxID=2051957 RepID=UPI0013C5277D|nr:GntR family transcriptional regulator [Rubrobacter indicoceani]